MAIDRSGFRSLEAIDEELSKIPGWDTAVENVRVTESLSTKRAITEDIIHFTSIPDSFFTDDVIPTPSVTAAVRLRARAYLSLAKLVALDAALFEPARKDQAIEYVTSAKSLIEQLRKKGALCGEDYLTLLTLLGEVELLLRLTAVLEPDWMLKFLG